MNQQLPMTEVQEEAYTHVWVLFAGLQLQWEMRRGEFPKPGSFWFYVNGMRN